MRVGVKKDNLRTEQGIEVFSDWSREKRVSYLNRILDITGLQSRTITPKVAAFKSYPIKQQEFITACAPDTYILCINKNDSLNYIRRTIKYLESIFPSKVIALCVNDALSPISLFKFIVLRIKFGLMFLKRTYCLSSEKSLCKLAMYVIRYYR